MNQPTVVTGQIKRDDVGSTRAAARNYVEVRGITASRGSHAGAACVISGEHDFHKIRRGVVLVAPSAPNMWALVSKKIGALVTDSGAVLSNPSTIAREYRLPVVVGTGNGTAVIRDGQWVVVDAGSGVVRVYG